MLIWVLSFTVTDYEINIWDAINCYPEEMQYIHLLTFIYRERAGAKYY